MCQGWLLVDLRIIPTWNYEGSFVQLGLMGAISAIELMRTCRKYV